MGTHDGHRARMKARFVRCGLDNFDDHSVLELLLFYAVPRRDVNELAHALLDHFGTLDAVFEASFEDMMQVPGAGENARPAGQPPLSAGQAPPAETPALERGGGAVPRAAVSV